MKVKRKNENDRRNNDRVITKLDITAVIEDREALTEMRNLSGNGMQILEPADIEMHPEQKCQIVLKEGNTF